MLKENNKVFTNLQNFIDVSITIVAYYLAYIIRFTFFETEFSIGHIKSLNWLGVLIAFIWWFTFRSSRLYQSYRYQSFYTVLLQVLRTVPASFILFVASIMLFKLPDTGRLLLGIFAVFDILFLVGGRMLIFEMKLYFRHSGYNTRNVLIIGHGGHTEELIQIIQDHPGWGMILLGFLTFDGIKPKILSSQEATIPFLGGTQDLSQIVKDQVVDIVFIMVPPSQIEALQPLIRQCLAIGISVKVNASLFDDLGYVQPQWDEIGPIPLFSFEMTHHSPYMLTLKEVIDSLVALVGLVLLAPVFMTIAVAIKLDSRGPILFVQKRVGIHGRLFNFFKFRSMVTNAEALQEQLIDKNEQDGPVFKIKDDPRVTRVGRFLRKTSLDELPQLFNVLIGDMSLVGPRPPLPKEVEQYKQWQRRRLSVKPGITCTWQVSGRNSINFEAWMKMDMNYIDDWSLSKDVELLAKTIPAVIMQKGVKE